MNCRFPHQHRHSAEKNAPNSRAGFSLVELLTVIFILSILIILLITAIEPEKHFASVRNRTRQQHVSMIANAIAQAAEEDSSLLFSIPTSAAQEICSTASCTDLLNFSVLVNKGYLPEIPRDPGFSPENEPEHSGYTAQRIQGQHIRIAAPHAETDETVETSL